jgi:hypothetical protein
LQRNDVFADLALEKTAKHIQARAMHATVMLDFG